MNFEDNMFSEIGQLEKDKYFITSLKCEIKTIKTPQKKQVKSQKKISDLQLPEADGGIGKLMKAVKRYKPPVIR